MMGNTMATLRKFEFGTSFDMNVEIEDGREQLEAGVRAIREYTEDDICAARDAAFAEGRKQAREEALTSSEHLITQLLPAVGQQIDALRQANETVFAKVAEDAIKIAVTIARKVVPELARNNAFEEIKGLVRECLNILYEEPRVVVRVHERVLDKLKPLIDEIASACGFNGNVVLFGDSHFADTDCRVEWADGGADRNIELLWQKIDDAISRVAGAAIETNGECQTGGTDPDDAGDKSGAIDNSEETMPADLDGETSETSKTSGS